METKYIVNNATGQTINGDITINGGLTITGDTSIRPYKVYTALLTQVDTDPPILTVLENTLGAVITSQYLGVGQYNIISDVPTFTSSGKVYVVSQFWADDNVSPRPAIARWIDTSTIEINLTDINGNSTNNIGDTNTGTGRFLTSIEIRVYN